MLTYAVKVYFTRYSLSDWAAPKYISFYTQSLNTVQYIDKFDQHIHIRLSSKYDNYTAFQTCRVLQYETIAKN